MAISSPTNRSSILQFHAFTSSSVAVSPVPCENSPKSERHACMTSRSFATMNRPGLNSRSIIFNARIKSSLNRVARFDISVWKIRSRVRLLSVARSIHFCVWTAITGPASVATTTHHSIAISIHRYGMPRFAEGIICGHGALPLGTTRGHEVDSMVQDPHIFSCGSLQPSGGDLFAVRHRSRSVRGYLGSKETPQNRWLNARCRLR